MEGIRVPERSSPTLESNPVASLSRSGSRHELFNHDDTKILYDILDYDVADRIFEELKSEIQWNEMLHCGGSVPRLIAVQGEVAEDGSQPIYRHPTDQQLSLSPFSPTVELIRQKVETAMGHKVNHVLLQYYRDGLDCISEHSDKTLDISPQTFIGNYSLGAQRTMVFRTKTSNGSRHVYRVPLPHNSLCRMGPITNKYWLHGIRPDKRASGIKSIEESAFNGGRISLTFRLIGTFLDSSGEKIWGQGATAKKRSDARFIKYKDTQEAERMIQAFKRENSDCNFDWQATYGNGFDSLHIFR
ncbi:Bgt-3871 [Blumeria graminis f. sp. tritici]|uniref:Bgt-3871 n=2 Tax=Blumeria graminis f. sp. tritici TaxID=62690 RepID=A0A061HFP1_BLUGR|nr:hypothetical protein BGT96224_3871 [Blumeria graminis f. sp. tritici 96224]VCU39693.1 Bgt-3871 [Blumeria graminis f. sp. tritici]